MKIIHITDTHIVPEGETIYGLDPAARLAAVIDDVCRRHADADLAVITGDLADRGDEASYRRLRPLLDRLPMPVQLMIGNHDSRDTFLASFPEGSRDEGGFVQSVLDLPNGGGRLLFLDTNEPGWSGGRYCDERLAWLEARLEEASDRPAYIFMHHPPFGLDVPHFEKIYLVRPEPFVGALKRHKGGVRHIFLGHVHIPVSGVSPEGIPFTAGRGCNHQIVLDLVERDCTWAGGGPNYNIIRIGQNSSVLVHAFDLIDAATIGTGAFPPGP
jgi:3',5'-cyclic AMP phosphodiesterase CpdA